MTKTNVQKRKARPKRSIAKPGRDHDLGLWIDYEFLRKHQSPVVKPVFHDATTASNNRYLELADVILGNGKPKKKSKSAAKDV